jgi:hypothetical protein
MSMMASDWNWDTFKVLSDELKPHDGEHRELHEVLAKAEKDFPIETLVLVKYTPYKGVVHGYNKMLGGFYPGVRYPVFVKITDDGDGLHKVVGQVFEYSLEYLEKAE